MSWRDRLLRLLDRGELEEPAPDTVVELADVWLYEGPRLLQVLEDEGIKASGVESVNIATEATATTRMRIFVRYADATRAAALIEQHRRR